MIKKQQKATFGKNGRNRLPDEVYNQVEYQPAVKETVEHHAAVYVAKKADVDTIVPADRPVDLLRDSIAKPSLGAAIMNAKYTNAKYYQHTTQLQHGVHTLHSNNLYQIFTYVKNKAPEGTDVSGMPQHAKTDAQIIPDNEYHMSGNKISVKTLDINLDYSEIAAQLNHIVELLFALSTPFIA